MNVAGTLRWFVPGMEPDPSQCRTARKTLTRQSAILSGTWAMSGVIFVLLNLDGGATIAVPTFLGVVLGAAAGGGHRPTARPGATANNPRRCRAEF
jgi:adenylate cyclase